MSEDTAGAKVINWKEELLNFAAREDETGRPLIDTFSDSIIIYTIFNNCIELKDDVTWKAIDDSEYKAKFRRWIWEQTRIGARKLKVDMDAWNSIISRSLPSFRQRTDDVLQVIMNGTNEFGKPVSIIFSPTYYSDKTIKSVTVDGMLAYAASGAKNFEEFCFYLDYLANQDFIDCVDEYVELSASGILYLETKAAQVSQSQQAFVAMWFDESMDNIWTQGIEPAIRQTGYKPMRIDHHPHVNRIVDEILAQIRKSKFLIADFTHGNGGMRGGVYFEAGFALGLSMPVIWLAREDMKDKLHFDIRQYICIFWNDANDLREKLSNSIESLFGMGPLMN